MAKITLTDLSNLSNDTTAVNSLNSNNTAIEIAIEKTLSRDGTSPNQMSANLDMNSNRIVNLPLPLNASEPLRLQDAASFTGGTISLDAIPAGGTDGQVLVKGSSTDYDVSWSTPALSGFFDTRAVASGTSIIGAVNWIQTMGYTSIGDDGGAMYTRTSGSSKGGFQSTDGQWWALTETSPHVAMFGAVGDGATDDSVSIQAAIDYLPAVGGTIWLGPKVYAINTGLVIGDGTSAVASTRHGVVMKSTSGHGVGEGEYSVPNFAATLKYTGTAGGTLLRYNGPIHSCGLEGITFNGNSKTLYCIRMIHPFQFDVRNLHIVKWSRTNASDVGLYITGFSPAPSGSTSAGASENHFRMVYMGDPTTTAGVDGGIGFLLENSFRNHFDLFHIEAPGIGAALKLSNSDNNKFYQLNIFQQLGGSSGIFVSGAGTVDNHFYGGAIAGAITEGGGPSYNMFFGYALSDGEIYDPGDQTSRLFKTIQSDGLLANGFAGSSVMWTGGNAGSTSLVNGGSYCPVGLGINDGNAGAMISQNCNIERLVTNLGVAPGSGCARTFTLFANGASVSDFSTVYSALQNGAKSVDNTTHNYATGSVFFIRATTSGGTPASSNCTWSLMLEPTNPVPV